MAFGPLSEFLLPYIIVPVVTLPAFPETTAEPHETLQNHPSSDQFSQHWDTFNAFKECTVYFSYYLECTEQPHEWHTLFWSFLQKCIFHQNCIALQTNFEMTKIRNNSSSKKIIPTSNHVIFKNRIFTAVPKLIPYCFVFLPCVSLENEQIRFNPAAHFLSNERHPLRDTSFHKSIWLPTATYILIPFYNSLQSGTNIEISVLEHYPKFLLIFENHHQSKSLLAYRFINTSHHCQTQKINTALLTIQSFGIHQLPSQYNLKSLQILITKQLLKQLNKNPITSSSLSSNERPYSDNFTLIGEAHLILRHYNLSNAFLQNCLKVTLPSKLTISPGYIHDHLLQNYFSPFGSDPQTGGIEYVTVFRKANLKLKNLSETVWSLLKPLQLLIWLLLLVSTILVATLVYYLFGGLGSYRLILWWSFAATVEQGNIPKAPGNLKLMIVIIIWLFIGVIVRCHYTLVMYSDVTFTPYPKNLPTNLTAFVSENEDESQLKLLVTKCAFNSLQKYVKDLRASFTVKGNEFLERASCNVSIILKEGFTGTKNVDDDYQDAPVTFRDSKCHKNKIEGETDGFVVAFQTFESSDACGNAVEDFDEYLIPALMFAPTFVVYGNDENAKETYFMVYYWKNYGYLTEIYEKALAHLSAAGILDFLDKVNNVVKLYMNLEAFIGEYEDMVDIKNFFTASTIFQEEMQNTRIGFSLGSNVEHFKLDGKSSIFMPAKRQELFHVWMFWSGLIVVCITAFIAEYIGDLIWRSSCCLHVLIKRDLRKTS